MNTYEITFTRENGSMTLADREKMQQAREAFEKLALAAHAKKARTRKKYRNRIRRYVFEALAAEGGGGP